MYLSLVGPVLYILLYVTALVWPGLRPWLEEENFVMTDERRLDVMRRNISIEFPALTVVRGPSFLEVYEANTRLGILTAADYSDETELVYSWTED